MVAAFVHPKGPARVLYSGGPRRPAEKESFTDDQETEEALSPNHERARDREGPGRARGDCHRPYDQRHRHPAVRQSHGGDRVQALDAEVIVRRPAMASDRNGLVLSTNHRRAAARYREGIENYLSGRFDPFASIEAAIE